jgi:two-component system cell cycle sensor histidine kinase/response regulator CckA
LNGKGVILVVDDTPESLLLLTEILAAEGYEVRPADSGELAIAAATAVRPELILLDIRMPFMDGFEVFRRLKSQEDTRDIPVVFMSATAEAGERLHGWRIGAVDFVSKPFEKQELMARVATRLELSRLQKRLEELVVERTASLETANQKLREELAERIGAEQARRESEARFRNMADTATALIWTSGPDTRIDFCNAYASTFTGRSVNDLLGDGWKAVIHPEDLERRYPAYVPVIQAHSPYQAEYRIRRADGAYRWFLDTATPRFLAHGAFAGFVGIAMDITDLKRNQEQLLTGQKYESLGVLVAGVAHRFNNFMGTIIAEADLAGSELPRESPEYESIQRINATAIRAAEIVSLLMAYAGAGSTGMRGPLNISDVTEEALRLFRATALKRVGFSVDLRRNLPSINADAAQIRQIVMNLLTNAQEALSTEQGSIGVTTSSVTIRAGEAASYGSLPPGEYVCLQVTDTGCGIAEENRLRIFDPFYTTRSLGRGLGLAAVQGIVRSLNGIIRLQSTVGRGSEFEVLLPAFHGCRTGK